MVYTYKMFPAAVALFLAREAEAACGSPCVGQALGSGYNGQLNCDGNCIVGTAQCNCVPNGPPTTRPPTNPTPPPTFSCTGLPDKSSCTTNPNIACTWVDFASSSFNMMGQTQPGPTSLCVDCGVTADATAKKCIGSAGQVCSGTSSDPNNPLFSTTFEFMVRDVTPSTATCTRPAINVDTAMNLIPGTTATSTCSPGSCPAVSTTTTAAPAPTGFPMPTLPGDVIVGSMECFGAQTSIECASTTSGGEPCRWQPACSTNDINFISACQAPTEATCLAPCEWKGICIPPPTDAELCSNECEKVFFTRGACDSIRCLMQCPDLEGPECAGMAVQLGCTDPTVCPNPTPQPTPYPSNPGDTSRPTPQPTKWTASSNTFLASISASSLASPTGVVFATLAGAIFFAY